MRGSVSLCSKQSNQKLEKKNFDKKNEKLISKVLTNLVIKENLLLPNYLQ